jgi:hypothetical protein
MYRLCVAKIVSMSELKETMDIEEFFKLNALWRMEQDIESERIKRANEEVGLNDHS